MNKILLILTLFVGLIACENQEKEFPDFDYTSGYFPYQYPVRTLVLGDYIYDNSNDNNHKFLISVAMGGVYENTKDRVFDIVPAPELCNNVLFESTMDTIRLMPAAYYTLSSSSKLTIPAGKVNGSIEVQLTDAFFDDPLAIKLGYVIPVKLVASADVDTILQGKTSLINPDPRVLGSWDITPKNFTMFGVKFINPYHGNYLYRGKDIVKDPSGSVAKEIIYRKPYIEKNEIWYLKTSGKNEVDINALLNGGYRSITGPVTMRLTFDNNGNCTIKEAPGSSLAISGSGKFIKDGDEWGGKKRNALVLSYNYVSEVSSAPDIKIDDNVTGITYVNFPYAARVGAHLDTSHKTGTSGASAEYTFTGSAISIGYYMASSTGIMDVFIDNMNTPVTSVDTYSAAGRYSETLIQSNLATGTHKIRIVISSAKNPLSTASNVVFDYFKVTPPSDIPLGLYTHEVKDTLVERDRAVIMEIFKPVVFN